VLSPLLSREIAALSRPDLLQKSPAASSFAVSGVRVTFSQEEMYARDGEQQDEKIQKMWEKGWRVCTRADEP
jgi:hypothetical protein